eukprot:m.54129 g.54129  ORF g.54129 m.54129 type:complete len:51 (-) comp11395_c0_seq1:4055-4207(-)
MYSTCMVTCTGKIIDQRKNESLYKWGQGTMPFPPPLGACVGNQFDRCSIG